MGPAQLYYEQFFPLFLDGQLDVDEYITGQEETYLANFKDSLQLQLDISLRNRHRTEYNGAKAKAAMLFKEAGRLKAGKVVGSRTPYQINLEIGPGHDQYINKVRYILRHMGTDAFPYPYFSPKISQDFRTRRRLWRTSTRAEKGYEPRRSLCGDRQRLPESRDCGQLMRLRRGCSWVLSWTFAPKGRCLFGQSPLGAALLWGKGLLSGV